MPRETILAVEDEEDILELVRFNLTKEGYTVETAVTGEQAISLVMHKSVDLVLLDLMLPGMDGFEVCKHLKSDSRTQAISVIMLTAKGEDSDIVAGLELGADDYVTKPFSPKVLIARIRSVLRRKKSSIEQKSSVVSIHDLIIDAGRFEVLLSGKPIELTATEFHILYYLAGHPGWVFTRNQIIEAVKGDDYPVTDRSVDVQIVSLRKKLQEAGKFIETVRGVGYRFKE